ncbi:formyltransferase family protein [Lentzea sp. NPDC051213]|uniref:formyltransferase family protein n=1 Tax=Lentzea sp. NPDC051213 TaxID=3364126 RepID=UPI00379E146B
MDPYVLLAAQPRRIGLLDVLLSWLRGHGAVPATNIRIIDVPDQDVVLARIEFSCLKSVDALTADLRGVAGTWPLEAWHLQSRRRPRILVLASLADHCAHELLALHQRGRLAGDIVTVAANHAALRPLVEAYKVPFVHLDWPVTGGDPTDVAAAHTELTELVKATGTDLMVMARFMQILPPALCELVPVITVHHVRSALSPCRALAVVAIALLLFSRWELRAEVRR